MHSVFTVCRVKNVVYSVHCTSVDGVLGILGNCRQTALTLRRPMALWMSLALNLGMEVVTIVSVILSTILSVLLSVILSVISPVALSVLSNRAE